MRVPHLPFHDQTDNQFGSNKYTIDSVTAVLFFCNEFILVLKLGLDSVLFCRNIAVKSQTGPECRVCVCVCVLDALTTVRTAAADARPARSRGSLPACSRPGRGTGIRSSGGQGHAAVRHTGRHSAAAADIQQHPSIHPPADADASAGQTRECTRGRRYIPRARDVTPTARVAYLSVPH